MISGNSLCSRDGGFWTWSNGGTNFVRAKFENELVDECVAGHYSSDYAGVINRNIIPICRADN